MEIAELVLNYIKVLIWPIVVLAILARYRHHIGELINRTRSLDTPAGTINFSEHAIDLLDEAARANDEPMKAETRRGVLRRLDHAAEYLAGGRILWVDDNPQNNSSLTLLFREFSMEVETALSTEEALAKLRSRSYDILITDLGRGEDPDAGNTLLQELTRLGNEIPAIVHSTSSRIKEGIDPRAFAATGSANEVVHYVIDLMERIKLS